MIHKENKTVKPAIENESLQAPQAVEAHYKPVQVALNVPSGKLVISGIDFLNQFSAEAPGERPVNNKCGHWAEEKTRMEAFAQRGLIFGYIGNSVPGIFQVGNSIVLASDSREGEALFPPVAGEKVGSFCTDASSYFIADHDDYVSRGGETNQYWKYQRPIIITVEPGRYVVTHHYSFSTSHEDNGVTVYATLEKSDVPIDNKTYPEEILFNNITRQFPDLQWLDIKVITPFKEFEVHFIPKGSELAYQSVLITADRIEDETFIRTALDEAWAEKLREREKMEKMRKEGEDRLRKMAADDPEGFRQMMDSISAILRP